MTILHAGAALLPDGWAHNVSITITNGRISDIARDEPPERWHERHSELVPAMINLHSHAFQYGMAGLTERRGTAADSFWSWREVMYRFALRLSPDQMEAIASMAYVEMLEAGYGRVGEFHYLHHDVDGRPYQDPAEMAARICAAAAATGLRLTLLPVFYAHGGFGGQPPDHHQRRFICDLDGFERLLDGARRHAKSLDDAVVGVAPHSLRAVTRDQLQHLTRLMPGAPFHIHIAEQIKEVDDCLAWSGLRPVEWLFRHVPPEPNWCLVHATQMSTTETEQLAASGAVAGLCPVTEASLGDGIFNGQSYAALGGRFGIGTDSNICIDVAGELRQLEYSQRLRHHARNVLAVAGGSTGRALFDGALSGGAQATGVSVAGLTEGAPADIVSLDVKPAPFIGREGDQLLDSWIFASRQAVHSVWIGGQLRVSDGRHVARTQIMQRFQRVIREVLAS